MLPEGAVETPMSDEIQSKTFDKMMITRYSFPTDESFSENGLVNKHTR